jgi:hypothetical protein
MLTDDEKLLEALPEQDPGAVLSAIAVETRGTLSAVRLPKVGTSSIPTGRHASV